MSADNIVDAGICAAIKSRNVDDLTHYLSRVSGKESQIYKRYESFLADMTNADIAWFYENLSGNSLEQITEEEKETRADLETTYNIASQNYVAKGKCLRELLSSRLYRDTYPTFALYCKRVLNIDKTTAHRYILSSQWHDALSQKYDGEWLPKNEFVMRTLIRVGRKTVGVEELWEVALEKVKGRLPNSDDLKRIEKELTAIEKPEIEEGELVEIINNNGDFISWGVYEGIEDNKCLVRQGSSHLKISPKQFTKLNFMDDPKIYHDILELSHTEDPVVAKICQSLQHYQSYPHWAKVLVENLKHEI